MSVTSVRLQADVEKSLEEMAAKLQRSKNWLVNQAIRDFVLRQEQDEARWQETLAAMESVAQGRVASGDAVHTWLRSWGQVDELPPPKAG